MALTVVFDVNETLLDLSSLDAGFESMLGSSELRQNWFELVLRNAMAATITGEKVDFVDVARASLRMIAAANDVDLTDADVTELGVAMTKLQPHPDVIPALEVLAGTGSTLAALTNSPQPTAEAQLANAGLAGYFATIMSVDMVGRFKPAAEVYVAAAKRLQVPIAEMTMVAAHDWDIAGAMRAGARGALVTRPGVTRNPLYPEPDVVASDMRAVVDALLG